ncbi:hypothetical protein JTE90_003284 [Oedothorax gibbosus]|uniref:histone acetyltransferase n=1 Tax=Oedothorax gibbosus TaxID=931172 RepID=A0AAV6V5C7_9ARAC|nr:hypothetical protein JTE90_003284 [Oedothorax gibbosus]
MEQFQRWIFALEHASHCENINCCLLSQPTCEKVKKIMSHVKRCCICANCKKVITLICCPAKKCQENKCPLLFCLGIQRKLRADNGTIANSKMLNGNCSKSTTRQTFHGSSSRTSQPSPYTRPAMPHMVGSPGSYGNSTDVNNLTANPALPYTQKKLQQHMQKPMPQMQPGTKSNDGCELINVGNWGNSNFNQNILLHTQPGQPLGLRPHSQMMGANNMHNPAGPACGGISQVMDTPGTSDPGSMQPNNSQQDLKIKQLLKSLKSSKLSNQKEFLQQKKQVLHVLNSDLQLMTAFINQ